MWTKGMFTLQIIDFHTHIYPDAVARKATQSVRDFYQIGSGGLSGTVDQLFKSMEQTGTSHSVALAVAIKPVGVDKINDFAASQMQKYPDKITAYGTVHAAMESIEEEVQRIESLGLQGVKIHPDSQVFPVDDLRMYPVYDMIQGKLPLMIHMGDHRYNYSHPLRLRKILDAFPRLQVIAAHFGGFSMYEAAYDCLYDTQCVMDVSSSLMFMPHGEPEKYIRAYGAERFLYGSDFPIWDPVGELERFKQLKLTDDEFEQIASKTALRILEKGK